MNNSRVTFIDGLRGLSLLGILLANMLIFQFGMFNKDTLTLNRFDTGMLHVVQVVIEHSFLPIFTVLFGFSLIKMIDAVRRRKTKSRWTILRRAIGLIVLGLLHSRFIWDGDILFSYGIMTLLLIPFINRKAKTLFIWAGIFTALMLILGIGSSMTPVREADMTEVPAMVDYMKQENEVLQNGSYAVIYDFRNNVDIPMFGDDENAGVFMLIAMMIAPIMYAPLFLIGMALAKINAFTHMHQEQKWYSTLSFLVPVGLALKASSIYLGEANSFSMILGLFGANLLAIGYIALFAMLYYSSAIQKIAPYIESVGKLSLTNYIMQSVICTTIFYGYGLGLFNKLAVWQGVLLGLMIYILQAIVSRWYLQFAKRGPLEYVLRLWTNFSFKR